MTPSHPSEVSVHPFSGDSSLFALPLVSDLDDCDGVVTPIDESGASAGCAVGHPVPGKVADDRCFACGRYAPPSALTCTPCGASLPGRERCPAVDSHTGIPCELLAGNHEVHIGDSGCLHWHDDQPGPLVEPADDRAAVEAAAARAGVTFRPDGWYRGEQRVGGRNWMGTWWVEGAPFVYDSPLAALQVLPPAAEHPDDRETRERIAGVLDGTRDLAPERTALPPAAVTREVPHPRTHEALTFCELRKAYSRLLRDHRPAVAMAAAQAVDEVRRGR